MLKKDIKGIKVDGILDYSLELQDKEKVFIFADFNSFEYCNLIASEIIKRGAVPYILWNDFMLNRALIESKDAYIFNELFKEYEKLIDSCDVAIMLDNNIEKYEGIEHQDIIKFKNTYYLKIFKKIMSFERWVYLRYPQRELAELFGLSYDEHLQLLEQVSNYDYESLHLKSEILKDMLDSTEVIRVINNDGTNVEFSKKGIPTAVCCGKWNLPDGEVYTAPEKYSMNGIIHFNVDTLFRSDVYKDIWVEVKDGKIISSRCNLDDQFKQILDSDEGSRYFGEFAFGLNPFIKKNYNDNLFNEKMLKTVHFAIGEPHYNTDNGNKSIMHWDLIVNMENGGEIYFDGKLVQKNGIFTDERLLGLNGTSDNNYQKRLSRNK
jgi:aminopeptidase